MGYFFFYCVDRYNAVSGFSSIEKTYTVAPNRPLHISEDATNVYPICAHEAMQIAIGTGYIHKKNIQSIGIKHPDNQATKEEELRMDSAARWYVYAEYSIKVGKKVFIKNKYILIDAFTGAIIEKGYVSRTTECISDENGGYAYTQHTRLIKQATHKCIILGLLK